jgi:16S rRNA (guanine527-N7)-methyltransferase
VLVTDTAVDERIREGLTSLNESPSDRQIGMLARYIGVLEKWNRAFNLTAVRDPLEMVSKHIIDSVSARPFLHGISILDVGTGAGLPGIALAVLDTQRQFSLLDSGGKKIRFVRHVVGELALTNVDVVQARAEEFSPPDPFDTVICRAFASIQEFVRHCEPLVANGGRLVAMKGRSPEAELAALPAAWECTDISNIRVPGVAGERHIVVLQRK